MTLTVLIQFCLPMSEIQFIFSSFDNLTSSQLEAVFNLRQRVFIIEQQCFYEDIDGSDSKWDHLLLFKMELLPDI